jgi:Tfp pilus assembly protein PilV
MRPPPGFTLVETLVALVLLQIGMLAVAATGAVAARELAIARRSAMAAEMARNRVETLRIGACATAGAGTVNGNGVVESWSVTGTGATRSIVDSVEYALPVGRRKSVVIRSEALCDP